MHTSTHPIPAPTLVENPTSTQDRGNEQTKSTIAHKAEKEKEHPVGCLQAMGLNDMEAEV
ncbi:hypothetical protein CFP56_038231 [Quercus suber]|uniref:Uncharacterized protein n=1 Tax=Quercus suber TaxID=58331 RepID=A0AAW0J2Z0_QUESU